MEIFHSFLYVYQRVHSDPQQNISRFQSLALKKYFAVALLHKWYPTILVWFFLVFLSIDSSTLAWEQVDSKLSHVQHHPFFKWWLDTRILGLLIFKTDQIRKLFGFKHWQITILSESIKLRWIDLNVLFRFPYSPTFCLWTPLLVDEINSTLHIQEICAG